MVEMGNIHKSRLLMLARHLDIMSQDDLVASVIIMGYKGQDGISHETCYPEFASALPLNEFFQKEWMKNKNEITVLKKKPNSPSFASLMLYFNLDFWEFMHCFVSYFQNIEQYGGAIISHEHVKPVHDRK